MTDIFKKLSKVAKEDQKYLHAIKRVAVDLGQYGFAAEIRDVEKKLFPLPKDIEDSIEEARNFKVSLRMVDLDVSEEVCWLIYNTVKAHNQKKGEFSLKDAQKLIKERSKYYPS